MRKVKDEIQNIIFGNEPVGSTDKLKKTQLFLRRYAETSSKSEKQQYLKSEEEIKLLAFAISENLIFQHVISDKDFISAGAEQKVLSPK